MSCVVVGTVARGGVALKKQCQTASTALAMPANELVRKSMLYLVLLSTNFLHANDDLVVKNIVVCSFLYMQMILVYLALSCI